MTALKTYYLSEVQLSKPILAALMLIVGAQFAWSSEPGAYLDGKMPFVLIDDVNRQADAWATCAAVYEMSAEFVKSSPAQARYLKDLSNGASLAVTMTHVSDGMDSGMTPDTFAALWNYSKLLGTALPEAKTNAILADAEILGTEGRDVFLKKLGNTLEICVDNSKDQQAYIDIWRELAKSGLLTTGEKD